MTTDLVPAENMTALESLDPAAREVAVTRMLGEARSWLAHAVEATEPHAVANFKAFVATVAESTKQLNMSKEIQLDATEMVRRAERGVGLAIRKGQAEGTVENISEARHRAVVQREINQGRADQTAINGLIKTRPTDLAADNDLSGNGAGIYHLTDGVDQEQFEQAITEAKAEGNLSRANVVRKVKGEHPKPASRPEILRGTRRIDANRVIETTVLDASNLISPGLIAEIDFADLDRERLGEWVSSLSESIKAMRTLMKSLEKELHHVGV